MGHETKENINNKIPKNNHNKKRIIIIFLLIIIVVICVIIELFLSSLEIKNESLSNVGNTIGNIRNYGYIATDNEYLYFVCPNDAGSKIGINKLKKDNLTGESEMLIEDVWEITGINCLDGYLYFVTMADSDDESDTVDNLIHKMKTDGTEHEVINDNEFNNECYEIYVINDKIYYIGTDECIYYMNLDGSNKTKLNDNATGFIGITEEYIFFNKVIEDDTESDDDTVNYVTYMMNIDRK